MKYPNTYCVFDFETTGLDPATCKVLEIGAIKVQRGEIVDKLQCLIKWPDPVPENIVEITGITQAMVDGDGIDPEAAKEKLREFIDGEVLIGHNIYNFDIPFLSVFLNLDEEQMAFILDNFIDTAAHVKGKKINLDRPYNEHYADWVKNVMETRAFGVKFNVGLCCEELGIDKSIGQHRAMNDVLLTNEIYKKVCLNAPIATLG